MKFEKPKTKSDKRMHFLCFINFKMKIKMRKKQL